jgi:hypothetical protein
VGTRSVGVHVDRRALAISDEVRQVAGQAGLVVVDGAAANPDRDRRVVAEDAPGEDAAALGVAAVGDADDRPVAGDEGAVAEVQAPLGLSLVIAALFYLAGFAFFKIRLERSTRRVS